jgi:uncharacterized protein
LASPLKARIEEDVRAAMRARDRERLGALRQIAAAIKQREVDSREESDDPAIVAVLEKMRKQRRESVEQYRAAGREDLAGRESYEIDLIEAYLPASLPPDEIEALVATAIEEIGAAGMRDMGKVMAVLRPQVQGRADMAAVSALVKSRLAG